MASTAFSLEAAKKSLYNEGVLDLKDKEVGTLVSGMEQNGFAFLSTYGLDYLELYIFKNQVR
jgi:hypothetical protein